MRVDLALYIKEGGYSYVELLVTSQQRAVKSFMPTNEHAPCSRYVEGDNL